MPIPMTCPSCQRRLRIPDHLAGRRVTCPRCGDAMHVPEPANEPALTEAGTSPPADAALQETTLPRPARLGVASIVLGVVSVLVLCLPFLGTFSPVLSGAGAVLGLWGLLCWWHEDMPRTRRPLAPGGQVIYGFGARVEDYPLAGTATCLLCFALVLLPRLLR